MKNLESEDQWKESHAVIWTNFFDRICMFSPDSGRKCYGTLTTLYKSDAFS